MFNMRSGFEAAGSNVGSRRGSPRSNVIVIWTGAPPPEVQVANQVRSSTGATYAPKMTAFTRLPPPRAAVPVPAETIEDPPADLLRWLDRRARANDSLPPIDDIAPALGWLGGRGMVLRALRILESRRALTIWRGSDFKLGGQYVIRLTGSDSDLRTCDAPASARAPDPAGAA